MTLLMERAAAQPVVNAKLREAEPEFVLGGHSHTWAMGAPRNYQGPRGLIPATACDRRGYYFLEENGGPRTDRYWSEFAEACRNRDAIVAWNGNQHYITYLFDTNPPFDFFEPTVRFSFREGASIIPRRLIAAQMEPTILPLRSFVARLKAVGASSITVVGTPPPRADLAIFEASIRGGWRDVAETLGVEIETIPMMPAIILLKIWRVMQQMLADAAVEVGGRFIRVPPAAVTADGFIRNQFTLEKDFTHANDGFGQIMLDLSLAQ